MLAALQAEVYWDEEFTGGGGVFVSVGVAAAQGVAQDARAAAEAACGKAPVVSRDSQPNIFSEEQEGWLGKVETDAVEPGAAAMRDAALSAHLQGIVDRLVGVLPPTQLKFKVMLVDSDEVNGMSLAGGHIYIMRKLAAVAKSDDELAGVLGHEIGHIISHQFAFEATAEMKRLLKVTSVGDEADIRAKFASMADAETRDTHPGLHETDKDQDEADRIGVYAVAAAGYRPEAYAEFWNRVFFVEGKTGGRLSDLFGLTKPNQKRLRGMNAMLAALPAGCTKPASGNDGGFGKWQEAVIANQAGAVVERSKALKEVALTPPLRMGLSRLKFSPDGASILAQDDSSVFVLAREPLALKYRVDAENAMPANFSPDSETMTFSTPGLHTEQWSASQRKLLEAHELLTKNTCYDSKLAPDGKTMFCLRLDLDAFEVGLEMLDVQSGQTVWQKKNWFRPAISFAWSLLQADAIGETSTVIKAAYTGDGSILMLGPSAERLAFNLKDRSLLKLGSALRGEKTSGDYAFLGTDKLFGTNVTDKEQSAVFSFPDGKELMKYKVSPQFFEGVTNPGTGVHIKVFGVKDFNAAIGDIGNGKLPLAVRTSAVDEFAGTYVVETATGVVATGVLGEAGKKSTKQVELPLSPLAGVSGVALSNDGKFLAVSTRFRGAVWDLTTGKMRFLLNGFSDAEWMEDGSLFLDVRKQLGVERQISHVTMSPATVNAMTYKVDDDTQMRYGQLTYWKEDEKKKTWLLEMHDPATNAVVWSKNFPDKQFAYTASYGTKDLIFNFKMDTHMAKDAVKAAPALGAQASAIKTKDAARLIQVIDGKTGGDAGQLVVELPPNYAGVDGLNRVGDLLYVQGVDRRTGVYSMASGKMLRQLFGYVRALDPKTGRVCTTNRRGEAIVYDAEGVELAHYQLGDAIVFAMFREDGKVVTVLTSDQKVRTMAVGK